MSFFHLVCFVVEWFQDIIGCPEFMESVNDHLLQPEETPVNHVEGQVITQTYFVLADNEKMPINV